MLMLGLVETTGQLSTANSVCWYGHVLRREQEFYVVNKNVKNDMEMVGGC